MSAVSIQLSDPRAVPGQTAWLRNVYPFYIHDLSQYDAHAYTLTAEGTWEPDHLDWWLSKPFCHPIVILHDGTPAGFAMVGEAPFPFVSDGVRFQLTESDPGGEPAGRGAFFVHDRYHLRIDSMSLHDDDAALTDYVLHRYAALLTTAERLALKAAEMRARAEGAGGCAVTSQLRMVQRELAGEPGVAELLVLPLPTLRRHVRDRILARETASIDLTPLRSRHTP